LPNIVAATGYNLLKESGTINLDDVKTIIDQLGSGYWDYTKERIHAIGYVIEMLAFVIDISLVVG
jgi:hypothetical protein